jgi:hypothetical protein
MKSRRIHPQLCSFSLASFQSLAILANHLLRYLDMYYTIPVLAAVGGLLAPLVNAAPHDLMVDNEFVRDVGVVYPNNSFTGNPLYLVTHKKAPKCETGISTVSIASAQICVPSTCVFYKVQNGPFHMQDTLCANNLRRTRTVLCPKSAMTTSFGAPSTSTTSRPSPTRPAARTCAAPSRTWPKSSATPIRPPLPPTLRVATGASLVVTEGIIQLLDRRAGDPHGEPTQLNYTCLGGCSTVTRTSRSTLGTHTTLSFSIGFDVVSTLDGSFMM